MNKRGTIVTGTVLVAPGFRDFYAYVMMLTPPNLQRKFDGCDALFDVRHVISCSKVGLVIVRNKKLCDKIIYLARQTFPSK